MNKSIKAVNKSFQNAVKPLVDRFAKRFPKTYKVIQTLKNGTNHFMRETYSYGKIRIRLHKNPSSVSELKWHEVEIYRQIPRDWQKVAPVIIVSSFPFLNYIILPLAHFWSLEQQLKFGEADYHKNRELYNPVLNSLLIHIDSKLAEKDYVAKNLLLDTIKKIEDGVHVDKAEILELNPIFNKPIFHLNNLTATHLKLLAELNYSKRIFNLNPIDKLKKYAFWLNELDKRLINEDLSKLEIEYIYLFCYEHGINANHFPINELIKRLRLWLEFSQKLSSLNNQKMHENPTLFLHSKVLLANSYAMKIH